MNKHNDRITIAGFLTCAILSLAGCYNTPEAVADRQARFAQLDALDAEFYDAEFAPLIDECLYFIKTGQFDMASLAAKGYLDTPFGIRKKFGSDHNSAIDIMGLKNRGECFFQTPLAAGTPAALATFLTDQLAQRGYVLVDGASQNGKYLFAKGSETIYVSGATGGGAGVTFSRP